MGTCTSYLSHTRYTQTSCCTLIYCIITKCECWSCIIVLPCYCVTCCVSISCCVCSCTRWYIHCCCSVSTRITLYCPYIYTVTYFLKCLHCSVRYTQISCRYSTHIFIECSCYCICLIFITCSTSVTCYTYCWCYCIYSTY